VFHAAAFGNRFNGLSPVVSERRHWKRTKKPLKTVGMFPRLPGTHLQLGE
jgi:hypothetical protein